LFATPASADPDAILDRSRTQFGDLIEYEIYYINARFNEIRNDLFLIPDITIIADKTSGSASAQDFINGINLLDDTTDVNVVLIETHGETVLDTTYLIFKDYSGLSSTGVNNGWTKETEGSFCRSMLLCKYTDLGNAFINNGFDTYFGFKDTVRTLPSSRFCSAFIDAATFTDVTVSEAARYAADEVEEEFGYATDVSNNQFIGNSNLCLRT